MLLIERKAYGNRVCRVLENRPVVAILGPRQCGKTTLARELFTGHFSFLDLERPSDLAKLSSGAEFYLREKKGPLVIDEAQRMPEIFPLLRVEVDRRRKPGQFVLLGSSSFQLIQSISESLAGRVGFVELGPLGLFELGSDISLWHHWVKGGFPDALLGGKEEKLSFDWHEDYTRALIERDLPGLGIDIGPGEFRRLWAMACHFHGELLNMNKMASSLGLSPHTVKRYVDILEHTFMVRRLSPYFANIKKRIIKSPKLYIRDSGLFHYFSRILSRQDLVEHPSLGKSFEGFVVELIAQILALLTPEFELFFFRTSDGIETDILLKKGRYHVPIEIKSTLSPNIQMVAPLEKTLSLLRSKKGFVIHLGEESFPLSKSIRAISLNAWREEGLIPFWSESEH